MKSIYAVAALAATASAHISITRIDIDGNRYLPFNAMVDPVIGNVSRIAWAYDHSNEAHPNSFVITETGTACGGDAQPAKLIAPARAGAQVKYTWSQLIYMHKGPVMSYIGKVDSPHTPANAIKFTKFHEIGYDKTQKKWANQIMYDNNNSQTINLPSNIAPGLYVLKSDMVSLHGNFPYTSIFGARPQQYTQCFTLNITGNGAYMPPGTSFPPGYKNDPGMAFEPYYGFGDGIDYDSKYQTPGPKLDANFKFDAPTGTAPTITREQAGMYPPAIEEEYEHVTRKAELSNIGRVKNADIAWPKNQISVYNFFANLPTVYRLISQAWGNDDWIDDARVLAKKIHAMPPQRHSARLARRWTA